MKLKSISFENYKAFSKKQTLELKPITILIGKNSSGKSSVAKLFTLIDNSLSGNIDEPLLVNNYGVELGAEFIDLIYNKMPSVPLNIEMEFEDEKRLEVSILQKGFELIILKWIYRKGNVVKSLTYSPEGNGYINAENEYIDTSFKGFIPNFPEYKSDFQNIDIDYIGPFRKLPERSFYLSGKLNYAKMGVLGENAYSILAVSKRTDLSLVQKVGEWYKENFEGWNLEVNDKQFPYYEIEITKNKHRYTDEKNREFYEEVGVNLVDVGQGMNQALPLVVRANIRKENSIIILEQPELHLHNAAHGNLAELFARSSKENKQSFVIETHSESLILRLRRLILENDFGFSHNDIVIYWVDEDEEKGQYLKEITIDEDGELSDWPENVFREGIEEVIEMRRILQRRTASR